MRGPISGRREFLGATGATVLGSAFFGSSSAQAVQSDETWSAYRGGAARSGYDPSTDGIRDGLEVEWTVQTARPALAVVGGETVYARGESLQALAPDGERKWGTQPASGGWNDVVADDDGVYVTTSGTVSAFDADGQRRWDADIDHRTAFLAHQEGKLFVSSTDSQTPAEPSAEGTVYALDPATGEVESATQVPRLGWYVGASSERLFVTQSPGDGEQPGVRALDLTTGEADWTWRAGDESTFLITPAIGNGRCYITTQDSLVAIDAATGREAWREQFGQRPSPPVVATETLYAAVEGQLVALDAATGESRWQRETPGRFAIGVGDTLYTAGREGLFVHDRATGELLTEFREVGARGVIPVGDGLLVSGDDRLYALGSAGTRTGGGGSTADHEIAVGPDEEFAFDPEEVRIDRGETVRWVWESDGHLITPKEKPPESDWRGNEDVESAGFVHEHTFDVEGVYEYVCAPHESVGMDGTIVVGDVAEGDTTGDGTGEETSGDGSGTDDSGEDGSGSDEAATDDGSDGEANATSEDDQAEGEDNESYADEFGEANESDVDSADGTPGPGILGALGGLGATAGWLARKTERENHPGE